MREVDEVCEIQQGEGEGGERSVMYTHNGWGRGLGGG